MPNGLEQQGNQRVTIYHSLQHPPITYFSLADASLFPSAPIPESGDWHDVHNNIKRMDQLYDATFYSWLKSEDNVLVTAMYLHRIANEYPLERITNALKWLVADWRWESTSILVRHVTVDWCDEAGKET